MGQSLFRNIDGTREQKLPRATLLLQRQRQPYEPELESAHTAVGRHADEEGNAVVLRLQWRELVTAGDVMDCGRMAGLPGHWGMIIQVRNDCQATLACPLNAIQFYVERAHSDQASGADAISLKQLQQLSCLVDPMVTVLSNLLISRPASDRAELASLFGQIATALRLHVVGRYGKDAGPMQQPRGGLAPWQLRRAMGMMEARIMEDLRLAEIAQVCRLSASHFGRAFRQTTGQPPHRWLLERRIDKARLMLEASDEPLSAVALQCGFTDQSHFTRAFTAKVGISPGRWRRQQRSGVRAEGAWVEASQGCR